MPHTSEIFITKIVKSASYEHKNKKKTLSKRLLSHFLTKTNSYIKSGCLTTCDYGKLFTALLNWVFGWPLPFQSVTVDAGDNAYAKMIQLWSGVSKVNPEDLRWDMTRQLWSKNVCKVKRLWSFPLPKVMNFMSDLFFPPVPFSRPIRFSSTLKSYQL